MAGFKRNLKLKFFKCYLIIALLSLSGCGSDSRSSDIYYIQERDVYLKVFDDGEVNKYKCSVNNGYQEDKNFVGKLSENQMDVTWNEDSYNYLLEIDESTSSYILYENHYLYGSLYSRELPDLSILLKDEFIPAACTNSAVDIVSITPETWGEAPNNSIAVNFNYRGQVDSDLILQLVYSYARNSLDTMAVFGPTINIDGISQSNITLSTDMRPDFSSGDILDIYVLMYKAESSASDLVSYGRLNMGNTSLSIDPDASLNTDCLTCINIGRALNISPFD